MKCYVFEFLLTSLVLCLFLSGKAGGDENESAFSFETENITLSAPSNSPITTTFSKYIEWAQKSIEETRIKRNAVDDDTVFTLFTRKNRRGIRISVDDLKSLAEISPRKSLKFLIHGFQADAKTGWIPKMVITLITYDDFNVITVDWGVAASTFNYIKASWTIIRKVADDTAGLINKLIKGQKINASRIQIIGHSLGAHTAGFVGKQIDNLGWIAALDPAGPRFREKSREERLDRSDASFVEVVYTDGAYLTLLPFTDQLGLLESIGHLNFYPNGGTAPQPGCKYLKACSHSRATELYIDSWKRDECRIQGFECKDMETLNEGQCKGCGPNGSKCALMGPLAQLNPTRGNNSINLFYGTQTKPPYCVFHIHVTLALAKETDSNIYGRLRISLFGDGGNSSNLWPRSSLPEAHFLHGGIEKEFIFFAKGNAGKLSTVNLKWISSKGNLAIQNITVLILMEKEIPPFIGFPENAISQTVRLEPDMDATFKEK